MIVWDRTDCQVSSDGSRKLSRQHAKGSNLTELSRHFSEMAWNRSELALERGLGFRQ